MHHPADRGRRDVELEPCAGKTAAARRGLERLDAVEKQKPPHALPSGKLMPGQDNSVCATRPSKASISKENRMTPLLIAALGALMVATAFLSGLFGMAGGLILIGVLLALMPLPTAMVLHAITQMASNGWRAFLWRAHIRWRPVFVYLIGCALALAAVVDHPLRAGQARCIVIAGGDAVHGATDAVRLQTQSRKHLAGHFVRLDLHGADADDRGLGAFDGHLLSRRPSSAAARSSRPRRPARSRATSPS